MKAFVLARQVCCQYIGHPLHDIPSNDGKAAGIATRAMELGVHLYTRTPASTGRGEGGMQGVGDQTRPPRTCTINVMAMVMTMMITIIIG